MLQTLFLPYYTHPQLRIRLGPGECEELLKYPFNGIF